MRTGFNWGNLTEGDHLRRLENNIKMEKKFEYVDKNWIDVPQDRNSWRHVVNAVTNLQVS